MFHHEENATRKLPRRPKRIVTFEEVRDVYHLRLEDAYKKIGCTQKDVYKVINHQRMSWPRPEVINSFRCYISCHTLLLADYSHTKEN